MFPSFYCAKVTDHEWKNVCKKFPGKTWKTVFLKILFGDGGGGLFFFYRAQINFKIICFLFDNLFFVCHGNEVYHEILNKWAPKLSLAELNRTKSYKLQRVLFKTLECFPSALFPKLWNSIELELRETKSAKSFQRKIAKIFLDSYASNICKTKTVYQVDKLSLYYLLHPVIHKHVSYNICYPLFQPLRWVSTLSLILLHHLLTLCLIYHHCYV